MAKRVDVPLGGMPRKLERQEGDRERATQERLVDRIGEAFDQRSQRAKRRANWSAAEVEATDEGLVLTVPIEGDPDPDWDAAFRRAAEAHRREAWRGYWGHIRHSPDQVSVEQIIEGSEAAVRKFVDACIHEAEQALTQEAADRREDEEALEHRRIEASHEHEPTLGSRAAAARRMTERFRQQA